MAVPFRHTDTLDSYTEAEMLELMQFQHLSVRILKLAYSPPAFNIGLNMGRAAGAGIAQHLHWHVVPRWNGDVNFMTVIADVRVLPESLDATYERLCSALRMILEQNGVVEGITS